MSLPKKMQIRIESEVVSKVVKEVTECNAKIIYFLLQLVAAIVVVKCQRSLTMSFEYKFAQLKFIVWSHGSARCSLAFLSMSMIVIENIILGLPSLEWQRIMEIHLLQEKLFRARQQLKKISIFQCTGLNIIKSRKNSADAVEKRKINKV